MIRKFYKLNEIKTYSPEKEIEGHIFSFGRIGSGKSVSTKSILEGFHDNLGFKIFDVYGGERDEGLYWALPSEDKYYFDNELGSLGELDQEGPKQYKINLLYPYFKTKLPNKLPKKSGYVNPIVFTIPLKDISIQDIRVVCGNISASSEYAWNEILHKAKNNDNSGSLYKLSKDVNATKTIIYKNFILPLSRENLIMHQNCDYNIDLISEAKDIETITVLCLSYTPKKYHLFIINYILRKLVELMDLNKLGRKKNNIIFIREASEFFRATAESVLEERFKIFRDNVSFYMKMGRRGMYFACDCQSPAEVRGLLQGCLSGDTILRNYNLRLSEMPENFKVDSLNLNTNKIEINNAKKISSGYQECYKITFEDNSSVVATENHRFFNENKQEVKVKNLKVGDKLIFVK